MNRRRIGTGALAIIREYECCERIFSLAFCFASRSGCNGPLPAYSRWPLRGIHEAL